jgi:hypothetical protein
MKKALFPAVLIALAVLYFGCSKKRTYMEFDIPYTSTIAIPSLTANVTTTFVTAEYVTDIARHLEENGTNSNLVGEIKYTQFSIAATSPTIGTGSTLSYIRSMKFYLEAINQPELQVAFKYNDKNDTIKPTDKTTSFHINENNLKNRFIENSVYFKVKVDPIYSTPPMTITLTHKAHVKAISE